MSAAKAKKMEQELIRIQNRAAEAQRLPIRMRDDFYFVSKKLGTRRGQCRACMSDLKAMQKNPAWVPTCARCAKPMERAGPGRRLCQSCFDDTYDREDRRPNGSHRGQAEAVFGVRPQAPP